MDRDRQARREAEGARGSSKLRALALLFSREEAAQRKNRRGKADIAPRFVATATQELNRKRMTMLYGAEAAEVMMSEPERLPDLVLEGPHDASPASHKDGAIEEGGDNDPAKWDLELRLRDSRNRQLQEYLVVGGTVFYKAKGRSMWPFVQSNDACTFHPIQAVTAKDGIHSFQKPASEILVGDIVLCVDQVSDQRHAYFVLEIEDEREAHEPRYWIGNVQGCMNGWCHREHIFGVLAEVQVWRKGQHYSRPRHQPLFGRVAEMVRAERWTDARRLCEPER